MGKWVKVVAQVDKDGNYCLKEALTWWWMYALVNWLIMARVLCQNQISRAGTSNYIPQILWDVITCPCPCLPLFQHSAYRVIHETTVCAVCLAVFLLVKMVLIRIADIFFSEIMFHYFIGNWLAISLRPQSVQWVLCISVTWVSEPKGKECGHCIERLWSPGLQLTHCRLVPYGIIEMVNMGSGNDLMPNGTMPSPEPMLTNHQRSLVVFTLG